MTRSVVVGLVWLVSVACTPAPAPAEEASDPATDEAARTWLKLVDEQKYEESWDAAAGLLKETLVKAQWVQAADLVRKPLGALMGRTLKSDTPKSTIPGGPEGDYRVMVYQSSFQARRAARETVVLQREEDGKWRVASYFLK
jgi:hypothetical protein